ncbi:MAG: Gfo/Idh/MocA family oxidoreductase [Methylobacteriaceae bacterium]|nr:Gfo/Idh/MocA family oxidoreductase [Methylobacteriaceae bacterium]
MLASRLRIGVLGAARIARAFVAGCRGSRLVDVVGVASRRPETARAFAEDCGLARWFGSYEAMLADRDVDAVYLPLPTGLHAKWAIRAVEAGKHVLCEKPLTTSAAEARAMFAAARRHGVALREAYPYLAQQQTAQIRRWIGEGAIGRTGLIRVGFSALIDDPSNVRYAPELGGGAMYDLGSYGVSFLRVVVGSRPLRAQATSIFHARGVDVTTLANLEFEGGLLAQVACSFSGGYQRSAAICGDKGVIETSFPNHPPIGGSPVLRIRRGVGQTDVFEEAEVEPANGFLAEAESFARLIAQGEAAWSGASEQESIDIAATIDAIRASARSGGWETVAP